MTRLIIPQSLADWNERGRDYLPGHLGIECLAVEPDEVRLRMRVERRKCAWNGFLHAGPWSASPVPGSGPRSRALHFAGAAL